MAKFHLLNEIVLSEAEMLEIQGGTTSSLQCGSNCGMNCGTNCGNLCGNSCAGNGGSSTVIVQRPSTGGVFQLSRNEFVTDRSLSTYDAGYEKRESTHTPHLYIYV